MSDTLTALRTALSPKAAMARIPFPLDSYQHPSLPLSNKRLLNMYAEKQPDDARVQAALLPTPGLVSWMTIGTPPIRVVDGTLPGRLYVVANDHFYRISFPPEVGAGIEDLTAVTPLNLSGMRSYDSVTVAVGMTAVVVCCPPHAYTCNHDIGVSGALHEMPIIPAAGATFPGASSVAHMDGYFAFTAFEDSTRWFVSHLLDPASFSALDFVYADSMPNVIGKVIGNRGELWLIGEKAIEIWYDSGNVDFPFRRRSNGVIDGGTLTARSVAVGDNSVWWVGHDNVVYRSNGYTAVRVSNHAIEAIIDDLGSATANGCLYYEQDGHKFYVATFGSGAPEVSNRTLVYDAVTGVWHERASDAVGTNRWRAQCATQFSDFAVFGDGWSGALMTAVRRTDADMGVNLIRAVITPPLWATTNRAFCARLEIEMEVGTAASDQQIGLAWSDDGGVTWSPDRTLVTGPVAVGSTRRRVFTTRLGSFRQRMFRLEMAGAPTLYAIDADIAAGRH